LDVFEKWRAVGGVSDGGLVVVGNCAFGDLELGAGMGKQEDMGAGASVLVLEKSGFSVGIDVELGKKREVSIRGFSVLVAFDVLDCGSEWESVEGMSDFVEDVPIWSKGGGRRLVGKHFCGRVERGPLVVEQIGGREWRLVGEDFVNEGEVVADNCTMGVSRSVAVFKKTDEEADKG
jgi:hypothetical protein